ncbi:MAG: glycogen debranching protein GlgX [Verrucomicrobiota bacterium]
MDWTLSPSHPTPLGATWQPDGSWNFAVFAGHATAVDLCLFAADGSEQARVRLPEKHGDIWHVAVHGLEPGQHYGYRVHGPWDPNNGHRYNSAKLLLDPYARAISAQLQAHDSMCNPEEDRNPVDSGAFMPKSVLIDDHFDWGEDRPPRTRAEDTVIYEVHVAGFTRQLPNLEEELCGTYMGLSSDSAIEHLLDLGVTAVQILPVHHHIDDGALLERGLTNYWGYQSAGFFAPESRYASGDPNTGAQVGEFKSMVKRLHEAGLEVILDVVYNHTGEGGIHGPTYAFRGFDNLAYYRRWRKKEPGYRDFTGCGNSLDLRNPHVIRLVLDSLRYWVEEMHVDGFRFDLAVTLGRESDAFSRDCAFFRAVQQDPILSTVKLIAEPWDIGNGGYQVGGFPTEWSELNGKFRDTVRSFWLDHEVTSDFTSRFTGSEDHYAANGRKPQDSVNFITAHDGFTLRDLVSYNEKHNEANGEKNRDGDSHNHSTNFGVEGETDDPEILDQRDQHRRNLLATMFLAQGTPFLLGGDELSRTQRGNNNAYCQDNEISWFDWNLDERATTFLTFVKNIIALRKGNPEFRRKSFFHGDFISEGIRDLVWLNFEAKPLDFHAETPGEFQALIENRLLLIFNNSDQTRRLQLPEGAWRRILDTTLPTGLIDDPHAMVASGWKAAASSLHLLEQVESTEDDLS